MNLEQVKYWQARFTLESGKLCRYYKQLNKEGLVVGWSITTTSRIATNDELNWAKMYLGNSPFPPVVIGGKTISLQEEIEEHKFLTSKANLGA